MSIGRRCRCSPHSIMTISGCRVFEHLTGRLLSVNQLVSIAYVLYFNTLTLLWIQYHHSGLASFFCTCVRRKPFGSVAPVLQFCHPTDSVKAFLFSILSEKRKLTVNTVDPVQFSSVNAMWTWLLKSCRTILPWVNTLTWQYLPRATRYQFVIGWSALYPQQQAIPSRFTEVSRTGTFPDRRFPDSEVITVNGSLWKSVIKS